MQHAFQCTNYADRIILCSIITSTQPWDAHIKTRLAPLKRAVFLFSLFRENHFSQKYFLIFRLKKKKREREGKKNPKLNRYFYVRTNSQRHVGGSLGAGLASRTAHSEMKKRSQEKMGGVSGDFSSRPLQKYARGEWSLCQDLKKKTTHF